MWRGLLLLLIVLAAYGWGVISGYYRLFPWYPVVVFAEPVTGPLGIGGPAGDPAEAVPQAEAPPAAEAQAKELVASGLVNFDLTFVNAAAPIPGHGGAFALAESGVVIARQTDGLLQYFDRRNDTLRPLPFLLPSLRLDQIPARFGAGRSIRPGDVRYNDIEIASRDGIDTLLVTYNEYDSGRVCFRLRLDAAELPPGWESAREEPAPLTWRQVLGTRPCLPPSDDRNTFGGNQAGGRMALAPDGGLILTTGDYEFDGLGRKTPAVSQAEGSQYGRVLDIDLADGSVAEVSRGHRNPQGLAIDAQGRIWVAEHGAMGGDELNLIAPDTDYGWPSVTLGVLYTDRESDSKAWPGNPRQGRHEGFAPPAFAWLPSIAPSSMAVASGLHPRWEGDLLVGTLGGQSIHHLRLEGERVLYDERIRLNRRVRDLAVAASRIYVLFDDGQLGILTPHEMSDVDESQSARSTALPDLGCVECHANPQLPRLAGVFGADVASQPDIAYSAALLAVEGTWTRERLSAFLQSPETFAPGATMPVPGLGPGDLDTVLDELERLKP